MAHGGAGAERRQREWGWLDIFEILQYVEALIAAARVSVSGQSAASRRAHGFVALAPEA
jgi:hypothetical protein